jgi:TrmH family RNA methyltransferase
MITSAHNARLKQVRALLGRPKERREAGAFVAEGVRLVEEAAAAGCRIRFLLHSADLNARGRALIEQQKAAGVPVEAVAPELMQSVSETESTQGLLAVLERVSLPMPPAPDFVLILDQIRDPGNLGTLLRTAAAAGVRVALLAPGTSDPFAPKVVRAGMGAHFRLPVLEIDWDEIEAFCTSAGLPVFLADMRGEACWDVDLRAPLALIVGGEAHGAGAPARRLAGRLLGVPMAEGAESLNAAVAGSVLIFEIVRQRWKQRY